MQTEKNYFCLSKDIGLDFFDFLCGISILWVTYYFVIIHEVSLFKVPNSNEL